MKEILKSDCCNAPIKIEEGLPDFIGDKHSVTRSFMCSKCGEPCDIKKIKKIKRPKKQLDCYGIIPKKPNTGKITHIFSNNDCPDYLGKW